MAALSDNFWRSLADETGCSLPISLEDEFLLVERSLHKWDGLLEFIQGQTIKGLFCSNIFSCYFSFCRYSNETCFRDNSEVCLLLLLFVWFVYRQH